VNNQQKHNDDRNKKIAIAVGVVGGLYILKTRKDVRVLKSSVKELSRVVSNLAADHQNVVDWGWDVQGWREGVDAALIKGVGKGAKKLKVA
jgi:hypothetical protein